MNAAQTAGVTNVQSEPLRSPESLRLPPCTQHAGFATGSGPRRARRAVSLANRIAADIVVQALEPHSVLGSEQQMRLRYGVGVGAWREAARILELREIGRMRRGPGGGFVVTLPTVRVVAQALTAYLCLAGTTPQHLLAAHSAVGQVALKRVRRAAIVRGQQRSTVSDRASAPSERSRLLTHVAFRTDSNVLWMIAECLDSLADLVPARRPPEPLIPAFLPCELDCRTRTLAALDVGDHHEARRLFLVHERHVDREWIDKTLALTPWFEAARQINVTHKRAGQIARNVVIDIIRKRLPPGARLGAEADLCRRYRVSKSVGRQVIGLLEEIDVVHCERGRGRGVYVHAPSPALAPKIARSFLASRRVSGSEAQEIGKLLEMTRNFERNSSNPILALVLESLRGYSVDEPN